jgi:putative glutamine amidotransferase
MVGIPCRGDAARAGQGRPVNVQNSSYIQAVVDAGGAPFLIPLEAGAGVLRLLFRQADGILLAGGGDIDPRLYGEPAHPSLAEVQPARDALEITLAGWALDENKPLLGICRGIQVMNVAAGGSLYQDIAAQCPAARRHHYFSDDGYRRDYLAHPVSILPGSRLEAALGADSLAVNSLHHQALKEVPAPYHVVGRADDGVIEGIEAPGHPFAVGVQWHPEELVAGQPAARRLFQAFVRACRTREWEG